MACRLRRPVELHRRFRCRPRSARRLDSWRLQRWHGPGERQASKQRVSWDDWSLLSFDLRCACKPCQEVRLEHAGHSSPSATVDGGVTIVGPPPSPSFSAQLPNRCSRRFARVAATYSSRRFSCISFPLSSAFEPAVERVRVVTFAGDRRDNQAAAAGAGQSRPLQQPLVVRTRSPLEARHDDSVELAAPSPCAR